MLTTCPTAQVVFCTSRLPKYVGRLNKTQTSTIISDYQLLVRNQKISGNDIINQWSSYFDAIFFKDIKGRRNRRTVTELC